MGCKRYPMKAAEQQYVEAEKKPKKKMGRKKVCPETLRQTGTQRKETFGKRTRGLFKKAHELASMCGCPINLTVGSEDGRVFHMHRVRNPCLDQLSIPGTSTNSNRAHIVSTTQCSVGSTGEAIDLHNLPPSSFLLDAEMPMGVFGNEPLPPTFVAPNIWVYNYRTEKMEYSGYDISGATPMDPPFSLLCAPSSCRCADCRTGRSRFVGRINQPIDPVVAVDNSALKSTVQATPLNPLTPLSSSLDDDDKLAVQRAFAPANSLNGFTDHTLDDFDSLDYHARPEGMALHKKAFVQMYLRESLTHTHTCAHACTRTVHMLPY